MSTGTVSVTLVADIERFTAALTRTRDLLAITEARARRFWRNVPASGPRRHGAMKHWRDERRAELKRLAATYR